MASRVASGASRASLSRGFTLLEMVVAIAIFALMAAMAHISLTQFLAARDSLASSNESLRRLQRAFLLLEHDVRFMVPRTVRDGIGETLGVLVVYGEGGVVSGDLLEFTTSFPSRTAADRHRIRRVSWGLDNGVLVRRVWPVLDRDFDSAPRESRVLDNVESVEFGYFSMDSDTRQVRRLGFWEDAGSLPLGVEIIITLDDASVFRRVLEVAGNDV